MLDQTQEAIETEVDSFMMDVDSADVGSRVRQEVETKFSDKKRFLLRGLKRAILEEEQHLKEKDHRKYKRWDLEYGDSKDWDMR